VLKEVILRPNRTASFVASLFLLGTSSAFAAGFSIFEQGSKATGMGGAFAATADDPSAIFYNVAGIAHQRRLSALAGGTIIVFKNEFRGAGEFPGVGSDANYAAHVFVPPNVYAVMPIGDNLTFGIGTFSAFGLRTDWEDKNRFAGRFISQDANLKTVSVEPAVAWKTSNGRFAVGVGAEYRTSHIQLERNSAAINPFTLRPVDIIHTRLDSDQSDAWGYNVGVMFRPNDLWSIGAAYRADMDIDYTGTAQFNQIPTGNSQFDAIVHSQLPPTQDISTTISYPAILSGGIATTMFPTWQLEFDTVYMTWSRFDALDVNFSQTPAVNLHVVEDWDNSYSLRLGANKAASSNWDVRLGAVYDNTPQPLEVAGPLLPDSDRVGISFGVGFHNDSWRVDVSDLVLHFYDRNTRGTNRDNFNGTYKTDANLLSLNLGYNF
jgi:long-chain fatty acid transport protein